MSTETSRLDEWVINRIKTGYKDDVQLLIGHNNYRLESDADLAKSSFFFAATDRAYELAKTFIIDGVGYDLFPMSWERIERITELEEDNASCVGEAEILYCRSEEDRARFLELQERLKEHLSDLQFIRKKTLEKLNIAMEVYLTMLFEDDLCRVRKAAGHILNYLLNAVAYSNRTYFRNGYRNSTAELLAMESLPDNLMEFREDIVKADTIDEIRRLCRELISATRRYLGEEEKPGRRRDEADYVALADWYQELSYIWREVYHWCDGGEPVTAFMRSCDLQTELDIVAEEFGLGELNILDAFDYHNLVTFRSRAEDIEKKIISTIKEHGVKISEYSSIDEFLEDNS